MEKVTIIIELIDNKQLNITAPLDNDRKLCKEMLQEALRVVETYKGGVLLVSGGAAFTDLSKNHENYQIRKPL